jgi:hypothetical protein
MLQETGARNGLRVAVTLLLHSGTECYARGDLPSNRSITFDRKPHTGELR